MWEEIITEAEANRAARRMRSWSIGRGQRSCVCCGRFLPLQWVGELCQTCQDSGRVPRPPYTHQRHKSAHEEASPHVSRQFRNTGRMT